MLEDAVDRAAETQPRLEVGQTPLPLAALEQAVDVQPVARIGRHAPGGGMRLPDEPLFLEPRQDVADGRRRQAERAVLGQPGGRHRLALVDVLGDQPGQNSSLAIVDFKRR